ncbi:MAG: endonuclease/exonuclease/phosphatase (EEP) superfamily protein YafD [Brevundimonas sp.]|jgi:endonuclease/exonuclease/phosphatase (EEP) superfamily protein YafD|uniref:endonuclease/exonuclease/phosphatase family protein n=1 Tax=Brevundimonas sp. TaxID=1871086 RepID=UPI0039E25C7E
MFNHRLRLHGRFKVFVQAVLILGLCGPLAIAAASLSGIGHRWVDILAQFPAPVLTLTVLATLVIGLARLWTATAVGAAVLTLLLLAVWPQYAPGGPAVAPDSPVVRLYAANLYAMNDDVAAMRASIEAADADIIVLVEFGEAPNAAVETLLAGYPHREITERVVRSEDAVRSVIASRYPLSRRSTEGNERQMISAVADTPIGPVRVVGVHLTRPWPFQFQWGQIIQSQNLLDHTDGAPEPVVLAGDFNSVASARIGRLLRSQGDLVHAPGWPGTWPAALPGPLRMTIDQVYHSRDIAVARRRLGAPTGSDHRPVIVELSRPAA